MSWSGRWYSIETESSVWTICPIGYGRDNGASGGCGSSCPTRDCHSKTSSATSWEAALQKHDWNQTKAAAYLDITRSALLYRMQKFGLEKPNLEIRPPQTPAMR
jgi:regulatory Fis family protein